MPPKTSLPNVSNGDWLRGCPDLFAIIGISFASGISFRYCEYVWHRCAEPVMNERRPESGNRFMQAGRGGSPPSGALRKAACNEARYLDRTCCRSEDAMPKAAGAKKEKCKNCEGKGTLKKGDKVVRCQRCNGTGIKR
jgi:hypothetical protein